MSDKRDSMTNIERDYYDNGKLRCEGAFVGGLPDGLQRHWHPNGVLAMEIPFDHGAINGMTKQWNDKGELLGTCELNNGTGTYRLWHANGQLMIEKPMIGRRTTGRERVYAEDGELLSESYWIGNAKVSKTRYVEACERNRELPRYENEMSCVRKRGTKKAAERTVLPEPLSDELPIQLMRSVGVREALKWLEESVEPSRSLGEEMGRYESIRLVKRLYRLGASAVHAVEIDGGVDDDQNSGRLVIELPQDPKRRRQLFKFCGTLAMEHGFEPESDVGQKYILQMLD